MDKKRVIQIKTLEEELRDRRLPSRAAQEAGANNVTRVEEGILESTRAVSSQEDGAGAPASLITQEEPLVISQKHRNFLFTLNSCLYARFSDAAFLLTEKGEVSLTPTEEEIKAFSGTLGNNNPYITTAGCAAFLVRGFYRMTKIEKARKIDSARHAHLGSLHSLPGFSELINDIKFCFFCQFVEVVNALPSDRVDDFVHSLEKEIAASIVKVSAAFASPEFGGPSDKILLQYNKRFFTPLDFIDKTHKAIKKLVREEPVHKAVRASAGVMVGGQVYIRDLGKDVRYGFVRLGVQTSFFSVNQGLVMKKEELKEFYIKSVTSALSNLTKDKVNALKGMLDGTPYDFLWHPDSWMSREKFIESLRGLISTEQVIRAHEVEALLPQVNRLPNLKVYYQQAQVGKK